MCFQAKKCVEGVGRWRGHAHNPGLQMGRGMVQFLHLLSKVISWRGFIWCALSERSRLRASTNKFFASAYRSVVKFGFSVTHKWWNESVHKMSFSLVDHSMNKQVNEQIKMASPFRSDGKLVSRVCVCVCVFSRVQLFVTTWTVAHQAPLSMGFSRQEHWSGLPCPPPRDLPDPGLESVSPSSPAMAGRLFTTRATWQVPTCPVG